jgi:hypothetical protein
VELEDLAAPVLGSSNTELDMKFGNWFEKQGVVAYYNRLVDSKDVPENSIPLFEIAGDFDSDIIMLCSTLIGIHNLGWGTIYDYPIFLNGRTFSTSKTMDGDLISSVIGVQSTVDTLLSKLDKGSLSTLAFKLLETEIDDFYKAKPNEE